MPTIKQRINAAIDAYKDERDRQTREEIKRIKAKTDKALARAKTLEDRNKAKAELKKAKDRLARAKKKGRRS